jgi:Na+/H+-dicarboxylate symporter
MTPVAETDGTPGRRSAILSPWFRIPFAFRMAGAIALGIAVGLLAGQDAQLLNLPAKLVLRLLGALAPPLILFAILRAVLRVEARGRDAGRLAWLLISNTTVAIVIGLVLANVIQPGLGADLVGTGGKSSTPIPGAGFLDLFPRSVLGPLGDQGSVLQVALLALVLGLALREARDRPMRTVGDLVDIGFGTMLRVLLWIIELLPFAVFCVAAVIAGTKGLRGFGALGAFVGTVILALALQACFYLARVRMGSRISPLRMLRGTRDALLSAFSTASSAATMPVTYGNLTRNLGVSDRSATLAALVGTNFNNDGTALYEAVAALFVAQALGIDLALWQQVVVMLASITASVGAAVPEAGIVSMTLVFGAVGLPTEAIGTLLVVDWLLDRCRTATNVLGDIATACLLEGRRSTESSP